MGFRFNKSIRLGKNFRINLSKSGIGYSYGIKGYRITKTAKGKIRQTVSIPGTGISYSKEFKATKNNKGRNTSSKNNFNNLQPPNKNILKIILLCILSLILLPLVPAIIATALFKKSNFKKSNKIVFIIFSWFLNFYLIGASTSTSTPNPDYSTPVIASKEDISTTKSEDTTELITTSENKSTNLESSSTDNTTEATTQNLIQTTKETTTKDIVENNTASTTIETTTEVTIQTTTLEVTTQPVTQASKELTTNNIEFKTIYVGNKNNGKLHTSSCRHAKKLLPDNVIQFNSRQDAISAGYSDLCKVCTP